MHTLSSMMIGARFSSQDSSPSQTWSPTVSFQGNVIFTWGLITTPRPTEAPYHRSTAALSPESFSGHRRNRNRLTITQTNSFKELAPRSNPPVENVDRSAPNSGSVFVSPLISAFCFRNFCFEQAFQLSAFLISALKSVICPLSSTNSVDDAV